MRNVTLKQLRALSAVARHGSVTAAAQALNLSPPAVTMQLQQLHELAGLPLLERAPSGMTLTEAGHEVAAAATRIEAILHDCHTALGALSGAAQGSVRAGLVSTAKYFAPRALAAFARAHPRIDLQLSVGNRADIIEGLRSYQIDLAVMGRPPEEPAVSATAIGDHPHVLIARPDHPLALRRGLRPEDLAGETFLMREPGSGTRGLMENFFAVAGVTPRVGMQIGSNETIKQAVIAGLGISFISAHTVDMELGNRRLVVLDVEGTPIIRQWFVVNLSERRLMPGTRVLRQFLVEQGRAHLPDRVLRRLREST